MRHLSMDHRVKPGGDVFVVATWSCVLSPKRIDAPDHRH
jgi:hypothetical protein